MENMDNALVLAVAISIVRHKPAEHSMTSYILDLRKRFPVSHTTAPTESTPGNEWNEWRTRALALEKENESLKLRLQKYDLELLASKASASQTDKAPKKKRKVDPKAASNSVNMLRELIDELVSGPGLPLLHDSFDILSSFLTLKNTNPKGISERSEFNTDTILIPNVQRSLKALGKLLGALLLRKDLTDSDIDIARSTPIHVADRFRASLLSLLRSTLPLAPRCSLLPQITEELCLGILRPVVQGFHLTSMSIFEPSKDNGKNKNEEVDIRPSLLRVIQQLLVCLHSSKEKTREIREFLVVETAKEIASLWGNKNVSEVTGKSVEFEVLQRLARKDSLWYHCAVIHLALEDLPQEPIIDNKRSTSILSVMAADLLYDLPRRLEQEDPVDIMAQGMILAVVEKAWLMGLCILQVEEEGVYEDASEQTEEHSNSLL